MLYISWFLASWAVASVVTDRVGVRTGVLDRDRPLDIRIIESGIGLPVMVPVLLVHAWARFRVTFTASGARARK